MVMKTITLNGCVVVGVLMVGLVCHGEVIKRGTYELVRRGETGLLVQRMELNQVLTNRLAEVKVRRSSVNTTSNEFHLVVDVTNTVLHVPCKVVVRVEPSMAAAEDYALELLSHTSVGVPPRDSSANPIGDTAWQRIDRVTKFTSILFLRHNVVVDVFAGEPELCEKVARIIDDALRKRAEGVFFRQPATGN